MADVSSYPVKYSGAVEGDALTSTFSYFDSEGNGLVTGDFNAGSFSGEGVYTGTDFSGATVTDSTLPSSLAVKTFVDTQITGVTGGGGSMTGSNLVDPNMSGTIDMVGTVSGDAILTEATIIASGVLTRDVSGVLTSAVLADDKLISGKAVKTMVDDLYSYMVDENGAAASLDSLKELAAAIANDSEYATTLTTALAGKQNTITSSDIFDVNTITGDILTFGVDDEAKIYAGGGEKTSFGLGFAQAKHGSKQNGVLISKSVPAALTTGSHEAPTSGPALFVESNHNYGNSCAMGLYHPYNAVRAVGSLEARGAWGGGGFHGHYSGTGGGYASSAVLGGLNNGLYVYHGVKFDATAQIAGATTIGGGLQISGDHNWVSDEPDIALNVTGGAKFTKVRIGDTDSTRTVDMPSTMSFSALSPADGSQFVKVTDTETGVNDLVASGSVTGGSLTDGVMTATAGDLSGVTNLTASGTILVGSGDGKHMIYDADDTAAGLTCSHITGTTGIGGLRIEQGGINVNAGDVRASGLFIMGGGIFCGAGIAGSGTFARQNEAHTGIEVSSGAITTAWGNIIAYAGNITCEYSSHYEDETGLTSGILTGHTITDGTMTSTSGNLSATTVTTTAGMTATGTVEGGTVTDGTMTSTGGNLSATSVTTGTFVCGGTTTLPDGASLNVYDPSGNQALKVTNNSFQIATSTATITGVCSISSGDLRCNGVRIQSDKDFTGARDIKITRNIAEVVDITATGAVLADSLTDGVMTATAGALTGVTNITATGTITGNVIGNLTGNADTATVLAAAVNIGGVAFNGSAAISLPGVNIGGSMDTTGNADTATKLAEAVNIGGVSFDGSAAISLPGVNAAGDQDTAGTAAKATLCNGTFDGTTINATTITASGAITGSSDVTFKSPALAELNLVVGNNNRDVLIADTSNNVVQITNLVTTHSITNYSDRRVKTDIAPTQLEAVELIRNINCVEFKRTDISENNYSPIGFIAQEIEELLPYHVEETAAPHCEEHDTLLSVRTTDFVPLLVKAVQELSDKIIDLEARLAKFE